MLCRLYLQQELSTGSSITLPDDLAHYLRNVMRLAAGDTVVLFNGTGGEFICQLEQLSRQLSSCYIESFVDMNREMAAPVHIIQAACRSEKIETVLQKATELGAASFQIVRSERSSLKLSGPKLDKRIERWQKIVIEAAEQSGRTIIPAVYWRNALSDVQARGLSFSLHPEGATTWPGQRQAIAAPAETSLAVGPEGGWSRRDLAQLQQQGFPALSFGPRVMRTETAAPALLAAIQAVQEQ